MEDVPRVGNLAREQKRFGRYERNRDGWLSPAEFATTVPSARPLAI
jgi:hypothetical protein